MSKSVQMVQITQPEKTLSVDPPLANNPAPETAEKLVNDVASGVEPIIDYVTGTSVKFFNQLYSYDGIIQLAVILTAGMIAWILSKPARQLLERIWPMSDGDRPFMRKALNTFSGLILSMLWVLGLWIGTSVLRNLFMANDLVRIIASLLNAWIAIRLFSTFVRDPLWSKTFAAVAWVIAALYILRLLNPVIAILDGAAINMGSSRLSLYLVIKGAILLILLLWSATLITRFAQARISNVDSLTPSVKQLVAQTIRLALLFFAVMMAMNAIGVDLTALAVFSGAVGVGIGFGLQAIFSNLVAGIIILLERSIKVGDFVELESGPTGEVKEINIRSTLITTNDNVDILVPNSEFINNRVTNWTLRDAFRRTKIPFGVAYGTDKELVRKAALEAAADVPHMLEGEHARPPQVWLTGFGDSSLDFELVVWLSPESVKRPSVVNADYNWALETALSKYGIEIPFPQRDLHLKSGELPIRLREEIINKPHKSKTSSGK